MKIFIFLTVCRLDFSRAYGFYTHEHGEILQGRGMGLAAALRKIYAKTDKQFIFLIDEWDYIMRERQESETLQRQYLDFLRNLLKDQQYVALVYMTGILPVKKYGLHSALNMFREYSMTNQRNFEEYTGFTEEEVKALTMNFWTRIGLLRLGLLITAQERITGL